MTNTDNTNNLDSKNVKYAGKPINLGGQEYIIPALPLGYLEQNMDKLQSMHNSTQGESLTVIVDTVHYAIKRNYPHITREYLVNELLDLNNVGDVFATVLKSSGLQQGEDTEKKPILIGNLSIAT